MIVVTSLGKVVLQVRHKESEAERMVVKISMASAPLFLTLCPAGVKSAHIIGKGDVRMHERCYFTIETGGN